MDFYVNCVAHYAVPHSRQEDSYLNSNIPNVFEFHGLNCVQIMSIFIYKLWISFWLRLFSFHLANTNQFTSRVDNFQLWHVHNFIWRTQPNGIGKRKKYSTVKFPLHSIESFGVCVCVWCTRTWKWIAVKQTAACGNEFVLCAAFIFNWPNSRCASTMHRSRTHPYQSYNLELYRFSGFDLYFRSNFIGLRHFRYTLCQAIAFRIVSHRIVSRFSHK